MCKQLEGTNVKIIELAPRMVATDLHREREDPEDNKKEKNSRALTLDEFINEVMKKWKKGDTLITAGPGNKIVDSWEESMGKVYRNMVK